MPGVPGLSVFRPSNQIQATAAFATSLILKARDLSLSWNDGLDNAGSPFFIVNGEFDEKNSAMIFGEKGSENGTLDRLNPVNGLVTINGLDHYSIVNKLVPAGTMT